MEHTHTPWQDTATGRYYCGTCLAPYATAGEGNGELPSARPDTPITAAEADAAIAALYGHPPTTGAG